MIAEKLQSGEPPKHKWRKCFQWLFWITVVSFLLAALHGCNPYNKLHKDPPITTQDSANLSAACNRTFPPSEKSEYDIGKVDTLSDSVKYYKEKYEEQYKLKQKVKDSFINTIIDTCEMIGDEGFDAGYKQGYKTGLYKGQSLCPPSTHQVDTIRKRSAADSALIFLLRTQNADKSDKLLVLQTKDKIHISQRNWAIGAFSILLFFIGLGIGYLVKNKVSLKTLVSKLKA